MLLTVTLRFPDTDQYKLTFLKRQSYSSNGSLTLIKINSLSYPELGPHLVNPDHTPSKHNPDHAQGPKWTPVTVDRPTHWAPSARAHHSRNTWYFILELTRTRADYCMTHFCNHTTRSTTNKDHLITSQHTVVSVINVT